MTARDKSTLNTLLEMRKLFSNKDNWTDGQLISNRRNYDGKHRFCLLGGWGKVQGLFEWDLGRGAYMPQNIEMHFDESDTGNLLLEVAREMQIEDENGEVFEELVVPSDLIEINDRGDEGYERIIALIDNAIRQLENQRVPA